MTIDVLGTKYRIVRREKDKDVRLGDCLGYVDGTEKLIVIEKWEPTVNSVTYPDEVARVTIRHEIIHAFLYESGLWTSSGDTDKWAMNEEMVDWFSMQLPKIIAACKKAEAI